MSLSCTGPGDGPVNLLPVGTISAVFECQKLKNRGLYQIHLGLMPYQAFTADGGPVVETTRNYVRPPEHSYPVVLGTTIISSSSHNRNMPEDINNHRNSRVIDNTRETVTSLTLLTEQNMCL